MPSQQNHKNDTCTDKMANEYIDVVHLDTDNSMIPRAIFD